jgi:endonuclease YncB( thermonuclease family)
MKIAKILFPFTLVFLLAACGGGQSDQAAVDTQVAALINQQATADAAANGSQPTASIATATAGSVNVGGVQIQIPQEAAACLPVGTAQVVGTVTDVWSGDEIQVDVNGQSVNVRYIGVDAPDGDGPTAANAQLVDGKQVLLITDVTDVDEYGRLPRYVITADSVFVNLELVRQGQAFPSAEDPDVACKVVIKAAGPQ